jgi:hypothetical protein
MNAIKTIVVLTMFAFAGIVLAEPVVLQGEELKAYAVGENGRTLTIADGEKISFFTNGTFLNCNPKGDCDKGTYVVEPTKLVRHYENWKLNGSNFMPIIFKKDGTDEYFNVRKIVSRSDVPTLLPPAPLTLEELTAKKTAAQKWLAKDSITIRLWSKAHGQQEAGMVGLTAIASNLEAFPRLGKVNTYHRGDPCWAGQVNANIFERDGDLVMQMKPQASYCEYDIEYVFDPITKQGRSLVTFKNGTKFTSPSRPELLE